MTARRIFLDAHESRGLASGRVSLLLRPINPQPLPVGTVIPCWGGMKMGEGPPWMPIGGTDQSRWRCPFGVPGDALWGAEAWQWEQQQYCSCPQSSEPEPCDDWHEGVGCRSNRVGIIYRADGDTRPIRWLSSARMMPRHSRHALTLASVRVVRVRDVSEEDARACGVDSVEAEGWRKKRYSENAIVLGLEQRWTARYGAKHPWESSWAWALGGEVAR